MKKNINLFHYKFLHKFLLSLVASIIVPYTSYTISRDASMDNTTFYVAGVASFADTELAIGLVVMAGGVSLDAAAGVTFNVPVPISGPFTFGADSTLVLTGDMYFDSNVTLEIGAASQDNGVIVGNDNTIFLGGDLTIPADRALQFSSSNTTIDGQGHTLTFGDENSLLEALTGGGSVTLRNMVIKGLTGPLQFKGPGSIVLQNVIIDIDSSTTWVFSSSNPLLTIKENVLIYGGGTFSFEASVDAVIDTFSHLHFYDGTTFSYQPGDFSRTHLVMTDETSYLSFDNSTFHASGIGGLMGIQLTSGTVLLDNKVIFNNDGNTLAANSIEFGDGVSSANNVAVKVLGGATVDIDGYVYHNPA